MLKFLIDHNVPKSVGIFLKRKKYDVKLVKDVNPGMTDLQVIGLARSEGRIVVSNDKDFINLSVSNRDVDMILFNYFSQLAEIRIAGLKWILSKLEEGFGIIVLQ
ncbi:hypothetical protein COY05_00735 [Candidatus Peregrinibacteria bacterium CG_4_10_14_0_2_um_filter_38_24]|nr:MAG: hypothetical protein COY05_00735 [Candidatus Peregrinibacteria bacterium CG_4_10_14_0_2_um_filter_38_24]PJC38879.1 MAG: hypothetical protein CO044_02660 [Candidatus Peregrinibacteria bacterium CG_4_9_14_0_2_um_filter_38_9]